MIYRYEFEAYIDNELLFHCFCKSLNQVARTYDYFTSEDMWFEVYDVINDRSIDVKELMRHYHGEIYD